MKYSALNPVGIPDPLDVIGLNSRVADLNGKTIGLYCTFKAHWVLILKELEKQLSALYPDAKFTYFQYTKDLNSHTQVAEVMKDPDVRPDFEKWIADTDVVIVTNADAGSCSLYLTYNATFCERLKKPMVMTVNPAFIQISRKAAGLRGVPAIRMAELNIGDISMEEDLTYFINEFIPSEVKKSLPSIIDGLTKPLSESEKNPAIETAEVPVVEYCGNLEEVNMHFYNEGLSYGFPIIPPTEELVNQMLAGTDLPPNHIVARMPPMNGNATVEKIAVNAVMAGCLPTYMPVLIAAVEAMVDPHMWFEAYTTSVANWAPMMMVNGPIRNDIGLNYGLGTLSPYFKANATIGHAMGLIIMNIAGIKHGFEDMGFLGHEGRFGICIGENEEVSPWEPMHVYYGFKKEDSAVSCFWPNTRAFTMIGKDVAGSLAAMCDGMQVFGSDPGAAIVMTAGTAFALQEAGFGRKEFVDYIVEYARRPAAEMNLRWMVGNNHRHPDVPLPLEATRSTRKFMSGDHIPVIVSSIARSGGVLIYGGGGDHGGPVTKKMTLPKNWKELVAKYSGYRKPTIL